jgi:hypothetical protein
VEQYFADRLRHVSLHGVTDEAKLCISSSFEAPFLRKALQRTAFTPR